MARRRRSDPRYFPGVGDLERSLRACREETNQYVRSVKEGKRRVEGSAYIVVANERPCWTDP